MSSSSVAALPVPPWPACLLDPVSASSGVEKEPRFRDRVRGETTWPYGVADALVMDLRDLFDQAGTIEIPEVQTYENRQVSETYQWATDSIDGCSEIGFLHPRMQEAAFSPGCRPGRDHAPAGEGDGICVQRPPHRHSYAEGGEVEYQARLVVGADGKTSMVRRWTGGESLADPEHHRFGGVLVRGVQTDDRQADNVCWVAGEGVNWFAVGPDETRLYVVMTAERLRETGVGSSFPP